MSFHHHHHLLLLFLSAAFFFDLIAADVCVSEDSSALLQLKDGFSDASKLASWRPGSDCCSWEGVSCDSSTGRVVSLNLSSFSLSGKLDPALFNLTHLTSLNLAHNLFDGIPLLDLPFSRLVNLTSLNLSYSGFVGQIPADIGRLRNLVSLDISTSSFAEPVNISIKLQDPNFGTLVRDLSNLRELVLDGVNISADGYEWCGAVSASTPGLQVLSLSSCSLTGPVHYSLSNLSLLSTLRLSGNSLRSSVPRFLSNFSSLSVLELDSCGLQGFLPESLFRLRNLTVLDVSNNPMLSGHLPEFPVASALEILVLSATNFSGALPESTGNLKALSKLQLSNCSFSGSIPPSMANLTQMVRLDLSLNSFSGVIPPTDQWSKIADINLSHNNLTGKIPSFLSKDGFRDLRKIDMRNNSLSGPIPVSLFALPSLQVLSLSQNKLSGLLNNFQNASPSLTTVDLSDNSLEGPVPESLFNLSGLKVLSLASNNFDGLLDIDQFWKLRNLSNLDLSNNLLKITERVNGLSNSSFPKISTLKLVSCNLEKIPAFLQNQGGISYLDLSNNSIPDAIPEWIWSIGDGNLGYLNLSYNLFTSVEGPPGNLSMPSPMILDLHSNRLQGPVPLLPLYTIVLDFSSNNFSSFIPNVLTFYLNYTVFLSLSNNSLTGEIPLSICNASFLQVLDLSNNNLRGSIPSCLLEGSNDLRVLNLMGNELYGQFPEDIVEGCALRTINLNHNQLDGKLPMSLANCSSLEVLDIGNNHIEDLFPYWLGNLSELQVLVLKANAFYGTLVNPPGFIESNHTFSKLQIFDLSFNNFSGNLPQNFFRNLNAMMFNSDIGRQTVGYRFLLYSKSSYYQNIVTITSKGQILTLSKVLTIFTAIDFSNNKLSGSIPETIGDLTALCVLNFSCNLLTGGIPPQLGTMAQLESLDLSMNQLSGEIPLELTSLTFLSFLNVSYNNLVGRIPQGNQFLTFTETMFEGNELCGEPLPKQCNEVPRSDSSLSSSASLMNLNWQCIAIGLGFGGGLAIVIGPLMFWNESRKWYNKQVDNMLISLFPGWFCDYCGDVKVAADDVGYDLCEIEDEGQRFCLFCTQLEFHSGKAIIHHVQCSCPRD
ncbi:receptor-like protein 54 [Curcuma longa]|uniref:receptor-like protein 54 n=1 Tax=Curcuma longa TaxID=136217 RepID=UPI003D9F4A2E